MVPEDLDKLIEKYLEGRCTEEERQFVEAWYAALGRKEEELSSPTFIQKAREAEARLLGNLHTLRPGKSLIPETGAFWRYAGVAASLLVLISATIFWFPAHRGAAPPAEVTVSSPFSIVENTTSLRRRVILPDGSIVQLSPESVVRFASDAGAPVRELYLEGEAYFDVAHDAERPFFVFAGNVVTRVLGTSFTVRAPGEAGKVTVSVKTGKVTVYTKNATHKKTVLVSNQEAVYDGRTDVLATQSAAGTARSEKPEGQEMSFDETPVSEVLSRLMQTYEIDIVFQKEALAGCVLTSSFFEEGLYDRIDVICTAIGATYKVVDAQIVIESDGCNIKTQAK